MARQRGYCFWWMLLGWALSEISTLLSLAFNELLLPNAHFKGAEMKFTLANFARSAAETISSFA
jgi:hypothetical protein